MPATSALCRHDFLGVSGGFRGKLERVLEMRTLKAAKSAMVTAALLLLAACSSAPAPATNAGGGSAPPPQTAAVAPTPGYAPGSADQFNQEVGAVVYFDFDKYDLSPEARAQLDKQAAWLKQYPNITVTVEG